MRCSVPTGGYPAHTEGRIRPSGAEAHRRPETGRCEDYPAGVSSERVSTPPENAGPRPARLTYAAALVGLEGLALLVGGVCMIVFGATGHPSNRQQAVTGGVTVMVISLLPLLAARGLMALRSWSRGPAVVTQLLALPVAYNLLRADSIAIPAGIALAVVAVAALVLLVNPATTQALGIRGPGGAQDGER